MQSLELFSGCWNRFSGLALHGLEKNPGHQSANSNGQSETVCPHHTLHETEARVLPLPYSLLGTKFADSGNQKFRAKFFLSLGKAKSSMIISYTVIPFHFFTTQGRL